MFFLLRLLSILLVILMSPGGHSFPTAEGRVVEIAIDIDDTLVTKEVVGKTPGAAYITITYESNGASVTESYRVTDGAPQFVTAALQLSKMPGIKLVRVGFRSMAEHARNVALLSALKLVGAYSGKSAAEVAAFIRSYENRVEAKWQPGSQPRPFKGNMKKDLADMPESFAGSVLLPNGAPDISDIFLVDDQRIYSLPGQEKNLVLVQNFDYGGEPVPNAGAVAKQFRKNFLMSRKKLIFAYALIETTLQTAIATDRPSTDILWEREWIEGLTPDDLTYRMETREDIELMRLGTSRFHAVDPHFRFTQLPETPTQLCAALFQ